LNKGVIAFLCGKASSKAKRLRSLAWKALAARCVAKMHRVAGVVSSPRPAALQLAPLKWGLMG